VRKQGMIWLAVAVVWSGGGVPGGPVTKDNLPEAPYGRLIAAPQRDPGPQYRVATLTGRTGYRAANPRQGFIAGFSAAGIELRRERDPWRIGLRLAGYGRQGALRPVAKAEPFGRGNRVEYRRRFAEGVLVEWYVNGPLGLEQGFHVPAPPGDDQARGRRLVLEFAAAGDARPQAAADGRSVVWRTAAGRTVLRCAALHVEDALGRALPSTLGVGEGRISLRVDDRGAQYPLTIDPLFSSAAKLTANDGAAGDWFGHSVAIDNSTMVVGARFDDTGAALEQGSAYVFQRSGGNWIQTQKLTASDGAQGDWFGHSVAIHDSTIVVGANNYRGGAYNQGAVYVFERSGGTWIQTQLLTASDGAAGDSLGYSVAINGPAIVAGAIGSSSGLGSAYVFQRSGGNWIQTAKLTASDGAADDLFGYSVAIHGPTIVVGTPRADIIGAPAPNQGSAYVFEQSGGNWIQSQKLTVVACEPSSCGVLFGISVAIHGAVIVVGASHYDTFPLLDRGKAYVFERSGSTWIETQLLTASDGAAGDLFGSSVAIHARTIVVGAVVAGPGPASAYVFEWSGGNWIQTQKLTASDSPDGDYTAVPVAIHGPTIVIGASRDDIGAAVDQGSAYVYWP